MTPESEATLARFTSLVEPHLEALLSSGEGVPGPFSSLLRLYPDRRGKLIRPAICLATGEALGVEPQRLARFAASIELFHNGLLIHDDFEDGSQLRRGEPTLHRLLGSALAVHVGDALLVRALGAAFLAAASSPGGMASVVELQRAAAITEEGQALDLLSRERDLSQITVTDYFQIILKKTAAYTTVLPMRVAAAFAGLSYQGLVAGLSRFALCCGLAFQIQDDLRSFGSSGLNGKSPAEDLLEGKVTLPLLHFFTVAELPARERARRFFTLPRADRDPGEARWLSREVVERGCLAHGQEVAYVAAAQAHHEWTRLERQLLPGPGASFLAELPEMTVTHR